MDLLERGALDLVVSAREASAERFVSKTLIEDRYVAVLRRGHPALRRKLTLPVFADLPHLTISSSGEDISFVDAALAASGKSHRATLETPYLSAGAVLVQSNLVAGIAVRCAETAERHALAPALRGSTGPSLAA